MGKRRRRKMSARKRNFQERAGWRNRHHMRNKCRGGSCKPENILMLDERRHAAWHLLFKNMDFSEVAHLLMRCHYMKLHIPFGRGKFVYVPNHIEQEFDCLGLA